MQRRVFRYFLLTFGTIFISEESVVDQEALSTFLEEARMLFDASEVDLELPYYQEVPPFQEMIDTYPNYSGDAGVTMAFQKDILSVDEMDIWHNCVQ